MITERHAKKVADDEDAIQILERALMDMEDACVNMQEALKIIPNPNGTLIGSAFVETKVEMDLLRWRLSGLIRKFKRIAAEFGV